MAISIIPKVDDTYPEGDDHRERVTHTLLGHEYGWDSFADINWSMLRNNRDAALNVLSNPAKFPHADVQTLQDRCDALDEFLLIYGVTRI